AFDAQQQADQMRGFIIQQIIDDVKEYVGKLRNGDPDADEFMQTSLAFQMGLVFEARPQAGSAGLPGWLSQSLTDEEDSPKISQRMRAEETGASDSKLAPARTFNIAAATFANNPPQFEHLRHYTDANTIAIAWDLVWNEKPNPNCTPCQADPEHHLQHY